jgi:hypothetical protein
MRNLFIYILLITWSAAAAQSTYSTKNITAHKAGTVNMSTLADGFSPSLQNLEMPKPGSNSQRAKLMALKEEMRKRYPIKNTAARMDSVTAPAPSVQRSFEGNLAGSSVPNDNDMAISNAGKVVSVMNTNIYIYDVNDDSLLLVKSLSAFAQPLGVSGSKYDPKVCYDPVADRFIMVYLNGYTWQTSKIILGFSETNDPTGSWNLYWLDGSPLNDSTWSDYPVIGISSEDLYIGVNTFTNGSSNNSGFTQSCFWQIDKEEGYDGDSTLTTRYYYDILTNTKPIFNITPIKGGSSTYGPNFYLLSNRNTAAENDSIFVLHVTADVHSPVTTLQVTTLISPVKYYLPPSARQPSGHTFDTNDSRILGGYFQNNQIQFVQSTLDTLTGFAGVYHGFIHNMNGAMNVTANIIGDTLLDLGFPNISHVGLEPGENKSIITFNHSAATVYGGFSGIYYGSDSTYSPRITIKQGTTLVNLLTGTYERWGDYSGSQTKYNEPWKIWAVGSYGKSNGKHGTWIAELASPDSISDVVAGPDVIYPNVFPNPAQDVVSISFELDMDQVLRFSVYDVRGRRVATLLEDRAKQGKNLFSFNIHPLSSGMYVLVIEKENGDVIRTDKIVKK